MIGAVIVIVPVAVNERAAYALGQMRFVSFLLVAKTNPIEFDPDLVGDVEAF